MVYYCPHGTRVVRPLNGTLASSIRLSCKRWGTSRFPPIKYVINANARDRKPLQQLLFSLLSVGHYLWEDTIVVLGGGGVDLPPARQLVSTFAGVSAQAVPSTMTGNPATLVVVHTAAHAYDYHAYDALWRHRRSELISAQGYLYASDTTLAHPGFPKRLTEIGKNIFQQSESQRCSLQVMTPPLPNANLCAFGVGVLLNYGANFRLPNLTKLEAVDIEKNCEGSRARALIEFGSTIEQRPRKTCGHHDVYVAKRAPRLCWYYDGLNLLKFQDPKALDESAAAAKAQRR